MSKIPTEYKDGELIDVLKEFGLSEHEALVYFALLKLGKTTVLKVAKMMNMRRTTVYGVMNVLKKQGLVRIELLGLKQKYVAESPEILSSIFEMKKKKLNTALPDLLSIFRTEGEDYSVKIFEGLKSIQNQYLETLKELKFKDEYVAITNHEKWFNLDQKFFLSFIEKRAEMPIKIRLLFEDSEKAREHKKIEKNFNEEVRILPENRYLKTNLIITPYRIMMHPLEEPFVAVVITHKHFVKMQKEFFEIMWESSS